MSPYIIRRYCVSQDIWKKQWMSSTFTQMMVSKWHTHREWLCLPIEFSLEQSLHFCTMLALPLPPFRGVLSWGIKKKQQTGEWQHTACTERAKRCGHIMTVSVLTTSVTYCHLSETSPQFPHFSYISRKRTKHEGWREWLSETYCDG